MYYKIVNVSLKSIVGWSLGKLCTQYRIGEFVEGSLDSGLFVFDSLESIEKFKNEYGSYEDYPVFEVEVKQEVNPQFIFLKGLRWSLEVEPTITKMLTQHKQKKRFKYLINNEVMPTGTKCFKEVKLVRKVE